MESAFLNAVDAHKAHHQRIAENVDKLLSELQETKRYQQEKCKAIEDDVAKAAKNASSVCASCLYFSGIGIHTDGSVISFRWVSCSGLNALGRNRIQDWLMFKSGTSTDCQRLQKKCTQLNLIAKAKSKVEVFLWERMVASSRAFYLLKTSYFPTGFSQAPSK